MDASIVYGHDRKRANELRSFKGGKLKVSKNNKIYRKPNCATFCLLLGSDLQTIDPTMLMQTLVLIRFHNFLADELSSLNQHWSDEHLYQEARRILIAIYEHIAVDEWLKIMIGTNLLYFLEIIKVWL